MARKPKIQTRVPNDLKEQIDDYQEDRNVTQSTAVRRLIEAGLVQHGYEVPKADGMGVLDVPDQLDELETRREEQHNQLRQDMQILAAGLAVGVVGVLVAVAGISPLATVAALAVGTVAAAFTFGMTVFRRVITDE